MKNKTVNALVNYYAIGVLTFIIILVAFLTIKLSSMETSFHGVAKVTKESVFIVEKMQDHERWAQIVAKTIAVKEQKLEVEVDPHKCGFGKFLYAALEKKDVDKEILAKLQEIEPIHASLHATAKHIHELLQEKSFDEAAKIYTAHTLEHLRKARDILNEVKELLNNQVNTEISGFTNALKSSLNSMFIIGAILLLCVIIFTVFLQKRIGRVAQNLIASASFVTNGTKEISRGNQDLSSRTQEQASSLEETASTMEEITSTVKQTADNALKATDLAKKAVNNTQSGASISEQTKKAMSEISVSSTKISDIVNLVNEMAFQTNILAINAAIEAAKAGEQGKGFAVVAIEVRSLAQRSAEAAKEIKDLITESIEKVNNGGVLVESNVVKLKEIAQNIQQVSDIINEISSASKEEYNAIEQINKAVMELDSVTQQNSALVEEIASASENISAESVNMNSLVMENFSTNKKAAADNKNRTDEKKKIRMHKQEDTDSSESESAGA